MLTLFETANRRRITALTAALCLTAPIAVVPAQAQLSPGTNRAPRQGMSTKKKLVLVAGAALLYYLYKKHQQSARAEQTGTAAAQTGTPTVGGTRQAANRRPQLYRSKNGGVYYRDPQGKPVWLTVPGQGMQVPQSELQRYAPDYARYRGPAPAAPAGYRTQAFSQFDQSLMNSGGTGGAMMGTPPGPGGR